MDTRRTILDEDPWLEPHAQAVIGRNRRFNDFVRSLEPTGGLLGQISQGHDYYDLRRAEGVITFREWAPGAHALFLAGDFNDWNRESHPLVKDSFGVWSIEIAGEAAERFADGSKYVLHVRSDLGAMDRIPAYARRVVQQPDSNHFVPIACFPEPYEFRNARPPALGREGLRIYEAHVGMAQEEGKVGSFREFTDNVLPRIANLGYNAVQLMAIAEHPYYGSFGYHVSNFFAASSRFGSREDLKELIDAAHGLGLRVLMDVIHSHSVKNTHEGLFLLDGTPYQYFHDGAKGTHPAWDSLLFDYGKYEVQRFLLSNLRYWIEEFKFDGFRFDGVTSMLYLDHGLGSGFNSYDDYFGGNVDVDALLYLQLANELVHSVDPDAITIAEDVSGMPGIAKPTAEMGVGFDYRLAMGIPDFWIKTLKEQTDEQWRLDGVFSVLMNRRRAEKHIAYAESHDQALVGDKTLAFWLMDQEMYWNMAKDRSNPVIERGVALHKMIRLLTFFVGGEGYLNFMGNEFGHPEWIDFPREGNGYSYHHARRQWSLVDNGLLRYSDLNKFDAAMMALDREHNVLTDELVEFLMVHEENRVLVCRRGPLVFAMNFAAEQSYTSFRIPVPDAADYRVILDTDAKALGGHGRREENGTYPMQSVGMCERPQSVEIYLPSRSAQVLAPV